MIGTPEEHCGHASGLQVSHNDLLDRLLVAERSSALVGVDSWHHHIATCLSGPPHPTITLCETIDYPVFPLIYAFLIAPAVTQEEEEEMAKLLTPGCRPNSAGWQHGTTAVDTSAASHTAFIDQRAISKRAGHQPRERAESNISRTTSLSWKLVMLPGSRKLPPEHLSDGTSPDLPGY